MATKTAGDDFLPTQLHPITGEPFVSGKIERINEGHEYHWSRPRPPERAVYDWVGDSYDDDEVAVYVRDLTDEEFATATAEYEAALAKWKRTQGRAFVNGPITVTGSFQTASGASVEGVQAPDGSWQWTTATSESGRR